METPVTLALSGALGAAPSAALSSAWVQSALMPRP